MKIPNLSRGWWIPLIFVALTMLGLALEWPGSSGRSSFPKSFVQATAPMESLTAHLQNLYLPFVGANPKPDMDFIVRVPQTLPAFYNRAWNWLAQNPVSIVLAVLLLTGVALLIFFPALAMPVLIVATALNRYRFDVASIGIRLEYVALGAAALAWGIQAIRLRKRPRLAPDDALLLLYLGIATAASILSAPSLIDSLKFLSIMASCVLIYLLVKGLVVDQDRFRRAYNLLIVVGVAASIFGLVAWGTFPFGPNLGLQWYPYGGMSQTGQACHYSLSVYGTLFEPNIFGSYLMAISLILVILWLSGDTVMPRRLILLALGITIAGLALSSTRSALASFGVGLAGAILFFKPRPWSTYARITAFCLSVLGIFFILNVQLGQVLWQMKYPVLPTDCLESEGATLPTYQTPSPADTLKPSPTALLSGSRNDPAAAGALSTSLLRLVSGESLQERLAAYTRAVEDWSAHPWLGNGANVFGQRYITTSYTPAWIGNVELMALHDTGVVGLGLLVTWFAWLGFDLVRVWRQTPQGFASTALLSLAVSFIGLLIAYQATTAFWLGFTWVQLGLMRAATRLLQANRTITHYQSASARETKEMRSGIETPALGHP